MAMRRRQVSPDRLPQTCSPIKYLTENGFTIVRLSEIDPSVIDTPSECHFLVQHEDGAEREVTSGLTDVAVTKPLGVFMAHVFNREKTFLDPVLRPVERLIYELTRVDETREMRWTEYAVTMLLFSVVSMVVLYLIQRLQGHLPFNPQHLPGVDSNASATGLRGNFGEHALVQHDYRHHDADWPLLHDHSHARDCRQSGAKEDRSAVIRNISRDHATLYHFAGKRDRHRGRVDVLSGVEPRTDCRAFVDVRGKIVLKEC